MIIIMSTTCVISNNCRLADILVERSGKHNNNDNDNIDNNILCHQQQLSIG